MARQPARSAALLVPRPALRVGSGGAMAVGPAGASLRAGHGAGAGPGGTRWGVTACRPPSP